MILTLQTNTFGHHGGIPAYNRLVCRVLNNLNGAAKKDHVLVAMDNPGVAKSHSRSLPNLSISGFGGRRSSFVTAAVKLVLQNRIDLILAGHINYGPMCLLLKRLRPKMQFGLVIYGWEVWERLSFFRRRALQEADFVISISEYSKQRAAEVNGLSVERTFVLPNALEWTTNEGDSISPYSGLPDGVKLLSVGRMDSAEQLKGFDTVIEALPTIAEEVPGIQYIVVGTGTDLERHKQLALQHGMAERVHFLGAVDEERLRQCYETCDVFVMPSAQEGFGFVYLEAMQHAKPVVAAKSGGAPEVVSDGMTGCLVEYGNKEQLANSLIKLCLNPTERRRLGQAGFDRLQDRFTFARFHQGLTRILKQQFPSETGSKVSSPEETAQCAS